MNDLDAIVKTQVKVNYPPFVHNPGFDALIEKRIKHGICFNFAHGQEDGDWHVNVAGIAGSDGCLRYRPTVAGCQTFNFRITFGSKYKKEHCTIKNNNDVPSLLPVGITMVVVSAFSIVGGTNGG